MSSRWIRLDTTWSASAWVSELSAEGRLSWIELLCYTKAHGNCGRSKRLAATVASRLWGVTRNAVTQMEDAAMGDSALVIEGDEWVVTGWTTYQMDQGATGRMRGYRERKKALKSVDAEKAVTEVTRNQPPTETETVKTTLGASTDAPPAEKAPKPPDRFPAKPRKVGQLYVYPEEFERAWMAYPKRDGPNPKDGAYLTWRARATSGADPTDLAAAAEHYAQHIRRTGKEKTQYVMQAETFYGRSQPWREFVKPYTNGGAPENDPRTISPFNRPRSA